jgi:trigger factor
MSVTNRENMENRRVKLTICVDQTTWEKALAVAYMKNKAFFPVEGYAPGAAPRQALEEAYGADVLYQEAVNATFPEALVEAIAQQQAYQAQQ